MSNDAKARAAQPPAIGPGGRHGNRFAETEYAKDFSWTMKRIGSYFAKEKKLIIVWEVPFSVFTPPCSRATLWTLSPASAAAT